MNAPTLLLLLAGKLAIGYAMFMVLFSFGLWLGRMGITVEMQL